MDSRVESIDRTMHPLFQAGEGGSTPTSTLALRFYKTAKTRAAEMCRAWHSSLPDLDGGGSRICYVAECGNVVYAAAVWTNPASPKLPQFAWMQLKRFAIAPDAPKNTASRMLGWMARDIRRRFAEVTTLVSYQDADKHTGGIYAAAGWTPGPIEVRKGQGWRNRPRNHTGNEPPKRVRRWTLTYPDRKTPRPRKARR